MPKDAREAKIAGLVKHVIIVVIVQKGEGLVVRVFQKMNIHLEGGNGFCGGL